MKMQSGSDFQVKLSESACPSDLQKAREAFGNLSSCTAEQMAANMKMLADNSDKAFKLNRNSLSHAQLKRYSGLHNSGHFDTPSPNGGGSDGFDVAIYQAPFDGSGYRWSFSAAGSNFSIDEGSNRIYDADLGLTANQIAISLGVDGNTDTTHFTAENVSLLLINHPMKVTGYVSVVGFMQCVADTDDVKILDHSQEATLFGDVGLGSSETTDTHALYVDVAGENLGKTHFFQQDYIPHDTDDHDYSDYDNYAPAELKSVGVALPVEFNAGENIALWVGTGTNSTSHAVGQEIRTNTFQSWKLQEVWVITGSSYNP